MLDRTLITRPVITEKATMLAAMNKYVFMVKPNATKSEVKKVVKALYKVNAVKVDMVTLPGKQKGWGRVSGKTSKRRKAIVTLKAGESITLT